MKANESHAELMGDEKHGFFNAIGNAINHVVKAKQENNLCLNEDIAKMVCRLLNLFYFNHTQIRQITVQ